MNIQHLTFQKTKEKYLKFKKRLEKSISSGEFQRLSRKKKNLLISRVEKFRKRLEGHQTAKKGALTLGSLALIPGLALAQVDPLVRLESSNPDINPFGTNQQIEFVNIDSDPEPEILLSTTSRGFIFDKTASLNFDTRFQNSLFNMQGEFLLGDVDGDSDVDIVFRDGNNFYLAFNDGDGNFELTAQEYYVNVSSTIIGGIAYEPNPRDIDLVDFDADGDLDLLISNNSNDIRHFRNDGAGYFDTGVDLLVSSYSGLTDFEFADLDADGDLDLIHNRDNGAIDSRVYVKENTSGPASIPAFAGADIELDYFSYSEFEQITVFDMDGDTDLDIFVADNGYNNNELFQNRNIEDGTFTFSASTTVGFEAADINDVVVGDLDGDGNDDLLISFVTDTKAAIFDGTELSATDRSLRSGIGDAITDFTDIALGDLDSDGLLDMTGITTLNDPNIYYDRSAPVISVFNGDVIIDENTPAGVFANLTITDFHNDPITVNLGGTDAALFSLNAATGDLSTNQSFDWESSGSELDLNFVLSDGNKTRTEGLNFRINNLKELGQGYLDPQPVTLFASDENRTNFLGGDLDMDGDDDIVVGDDNDPIGIFLNNDIGLFKADINEYVYFKDANFIDFDDDGDLDLFTLRNYGIESVRNEGLDFNKYNFSGGGLSNQSFGIVSGDFDNDGLEDVASISSTGDYFYFRKFELNDENTDLIQEQELPFKTSSGTGSLESYGDIVDFAIADFDGDGNDDLLIIIEDEGANPGTDVLFAGDGMVFSTSPSPFSALQTDNGYNRVEIEDLNADGAVDIVAFRSNGTTLDLDIMLNDGAGSFAVDQTLSTNGVNDGSGDELTDLLFADMDGDGSIDIITSAFEATNDYELRLFSNDGNGSFTLIQTIADLDGVDIELIDIDSDDDNDVIVRQIESNSDIFKVYVNANIAASNISLSSTVFDEHFPSDTQIATISVTDINPQDTHVLYLADGDGINDADNNVFTIRENRLFVNRDVSFEQNPTLNIVIAADDGVNVYEQAFTLGVTDVNQAPTAIAVPTSFDEGTIAGTSIGTLTATDDGLETIYFDLVVGDGTNDADNGSFVIEGDQLILLEENTRFETKATYNVFVSASDIDGSVEQAFVIDVNDINQAPAIIELGTNTFDESILPGNAVTNIIVTDPNLGDTHTLSLVSGEGSDNNDSFTIQGNQLVLIETIEFNNTPSLSIRIAANDGTETLEQAFALTVNEVLGLDDEQNNILGIYPNPGHDEIQFNIQNDLLGEMQVNVTDLSGRTIHQFASVKNGKNWAHTIDMRGEEAGVYVVEVSIGKMKVTQRWVKQD